MSFRLVAPMSEPSRPVEWSFMFFESAMEP